MNPQSNRLEIEYCTQCRWLLRAAWLAQELLTTFEAELGEAALVPGTGGIFEVRLNGEILFSREREGRFPESNPHIASFAALRCNMRFGGRQFCRQSFGASLRDLLKISPSTRRKVNPEQAAC